MSNSRPKISVAVITYNQQNTIAQTLDSILMQKGDFDLELVVGEDCSTDNTLAICKQYAERNPNIIKLLSGPKNLGITHNFVRTITACSGEFIGDIAGDDYYIDDHALEKQMNYMLEHPDVGVMGANGYRFYVKQNRKELGENELVNQIEAKEFFFNPNYKGGVIIQGGGLMVRRELLKYVDFDEIIRRKLPVEDYPMQAIWSQHTKFWRLEDPLVVYRVYKESATFVPFEHPKYLSYHRGLMDTRRYLNELFPDDACFTEEQMQDFEFYKEFLLYLHRCDYRQAKQLMQKYRHLATQTHYMQATKYMRSWFHFIAFHCYKEHVYKKQGIDKL